MRFTFRVHTEASPEQVLEAFTDFTPNRVAVWSKSLSPHTYRLVERGETWASAREGSLGSPFTTVWRYDWSEPGLIRWTALEPFSGGGQIAITPAEGGGSTLDVLFAHHHPQGIGAAVGLLVQRLMGFRAIPRLWKEALDRAARPSGEERPTPRRSA
jgi:hypothetical protein